MKKYLILNLLAAVLTFSLSTCDCPEEFPIEDFSDLPTPFRVDSAVFFTFTDGFDGWYIYFNQPVDYNTIKGNINLRAAGNSVIYTGHFAPISPREVYISICDFASAEATVGNSLTYALELSGDGAEPILSENGQRLDGNNDATDGGVFSQTVTQARCATDLLIDPPGGSTKFLQIQQNLVADLDINFWATRMDTSSFVLNQTVFVKNSNNAPVPATLHWSADWLNLRISTTQSVEQVCAGTSCFLVVEIRKSVKTAFGTPLLEDYFAVFNIN